LGRLTMEAGFWRYRSRLFSELWIDPIF
jgi:hypothetical protein